MSRYNPRVWRVVVAKSRQHQDAEEILMLIFIKNLQMSMFMSVFLSIRHENTR